MNKQAVGIDYSMTCPAACLYQSEVVRFYYAHANKFVDIPFVNWTCVPDKEIVPRAADMAWDLSSWLLDFHVSKVYIEDYAFNATGKVFHIGEHAGILKYVLLQNSINYVPVPPTVIKKFATGKGNADKNKMTAAFLEAYPSAQEWIMNFFPRFKQGRIIAKSPLSDLADAFWLAKYAYEQS